MRQEMAVLAASPDTYLLHEHLEDYNEPLYFHQFVDRAAAKDLQYLGEAAVTQMVPSRLGPEIEQTLRHISPGLVEMEQYMDFLRNRMFRQTLLCHGDLKLDHMLRPDAVERMWIASKAKPVSPQADLESDAPEDFRSDDPLQGTLTTRSPWMKTAMRHMAQIWPESVAFGNLLTTAGRGRPIATDESRDLATRLLNCYTSGLVEFSLGPPRFVAQISGRPVASPYARLCAREGAKVVNMRLESTASAELARLVLKHLDGQHDRPRWLPWFRNGLKRRTPTTHSPRRTNWWINYCKALRKAPCLSDEANRLASRRAGRKGTEAQCSKGETGKTGSSAGEP